MIWLERICMAKADSQDNIDSEIGIIERRPRLCSLDHTQIDRHISKSW